MSARLLFDRKKYDEEKAKLPKPDGKHCIVCGKPIPKGARKYCNPFCIVKWCKDRGLLNWEDVKIQVLSRDQHKCRKCGTTESELEVHHIVEIANGGAPLEPDNCITLCKDCHKDETRTFFVERKSKQTKKLTEFSECVKTE